jgi:hypothetical protein
MSWATKPGTWGRIEERKHDMPNNTSILFQTHSALPQIDQLKNSELFSFPPAMENHPDVHFLNDEENPLQIDDVRKMATLLALKPYQADQSIFVVFNIEKASLPAQNALLKSLEEPPAYAQIILTTRQPNKILPTILSRCILKKSVTTSIEAVPSDSAKSAEETEEVVTLLSTLENGSLSDIFVLSENYKEREAAVAVLENLTRFLHQQNQQHPNIRQTLQIQKILETKSLLEKNVNVRLALEECFFAMKIAMKKK